MAKNPNAADQDRKAKKRVRRKPLSPHYQGNDDGGYGNPPVSGQFKRSGKGGPGRKKGETSLEGEFRRMIRGKVSLKDGREVPTSRALAMRAQQMMLGTSLRALQWGIELAEKYAPPEVNALLTVDYNLLSEAELHAYGLILNRLLNTPLADQGLEVSPETVQSILGRY